MPPLPRRGPPVYNIAAKLVQPFTFAVLVLGVALVTLRCRRRERQRALTAALVAYVLLALASFNPVAHLLLSPLEDQTALLGEPPPDAPAIVVLGGGKDSVRRCGRAAQL